MPGGELICPECNGLGKAFVKVGPDSRREIVCPLCLGSGTHADAVYHAIAGDGAKLTKDEAERIREEYKDHWRCP